jgi:hypothetical protein
MARYPSVLSKYPRITGAKKDVAPYQSESLGPLGQQISIKFRLNFDY